MKKQPDREVVLTWAEVEAQRRDSVRLAPGFWVDKDGGLHVSLPELLDLAGLPHTEENERIVIGYIHEIVGASSEVVIVQHRET